MSGTATKRVKKQKAGPNPSVMSAEEQQMIDRDERRIEEVECEEVRRKVGSAMQQLHELRKGNGGEYPKDHTLIKEEAIAALFDGMPEEVSQVMRGSAEGTPCEARTWLATLLTEGCGAYPWSRSAVVAFERMCDKSGGSYNEVLDLHGHIFDDGSLLTTQDGKPQIACTDEAQYERVLGYIFDKTKELLEKAEEVEKVGAAAAA